MSQQILSIHTGIHTFICRRVAPAIIRSTVGVVAVSTRRYIDWMQALHRSVFLVILYALCLHDQGTLLSSPGHSPSGYRTNPSLIIGRIRTPLQKAFKPSMSSPKSFSVVSSARPFFCLKSSRFSISQASFTSGRMQVRFFYL